MSETAERPARTPGQERDRRITRAITWLGRWDRGEVIAVHDGRTLNYTDLAALVEAYQESAAAAAGSERRS